MITEILDSEYAYIFSKWTYQVLEFQKLQKITGVNKQKIFYKDIFWNRFQQVLLNINLYHKHTIYEFCIFLISYKYIFQINVELKKYIQNILISLYYSDKRYRIVGETFYDLYYNVLPEIQLHNIHALQFLNNIIQKPILETRHFLKSCKNTCNKLGIPFHNIDIVSKDRYNSKIIWRYIPGKRNYILAHFGKKLFSENLYFRNKNTKKNTKKNMKKNMKNITLLVIDKKKYKQD